MHAAITGGYQPGSSSSSTTSNQDSVQAANGPTPPGTSGQTLHMGDGLKTQQLHTAQWNLDRLDQVHLPLNQTFM